MKDKYFLSLLILAFFSCGPDQKANNAEDAQGHHSTEQDVQDLQNVQKKWNGSIYKTKSGKEFELITNQVSASLVDISILTRGFEVKNDSMVIQGADPITQAFVYDLDENGYEEFYLITTSAGSGGYATIYGLASNRDKSVTPIYVPEITERELKPGGLMEGYMGHDSIYLSDKKLMNTFPVYNPGDENCCPTGGDKTLNYSLKAGEASWILEAHKN